MSSSPFLGRLGMRGSGSSSSRMPAPNVSQVPFSAVRTKHIRLRSNLLDSPYSCSSGVSKFSSLACSSVRMSKGGTFRGRPSDPSPSTPGPNGLFRAASRLKSLSRYHHISQRNALARLWLLSVDLMTRSKKSRGGKKCVSDTLGAYCARTNIKFTGLVRGIFCRLIFSKVFGWSTSSEAPLRMDLRRGASCSCL